MFRPVWFLAFGLGLLNSPAAATPSPEAPWPCREDYCQKTPGHAEEAAHDGGARSIQPNSVSPGDDAYDAYGGSSMIGHDRSLEHSNKYALSAGLPEGYDLPPGLSKMDGLPPGLLDDSRSNGWPKFLESPSNGADPGNGALPIPEPTGFGLFGVGLALVEASRRRRQR